MFIVHRCVFVVLESTRRKRDTVIFSNNKNIVSGNTKHTRYHRSTNTDASGKNTI